MRTRSWWGYSHHYLLNRVALCWSKWDGLLWRLAGWQIPNHFTLTYIHVHTVWDKCVCSHCSQSGPTCMYQPAHMLAAGAEWIASLCTNLITYSSLSFFLYMYVSLEYRYLFSNSTSLHLFVPGNSIKTVPRSGLLQWPLVTMPNNIQSPPVHLDMQCTLVGDCVCVFMCVYVHMHRQQISTSTCWVYTWTQWCLHTCNPRNTPLSATQEVWSSCEYSWNSLDQRGHMSCP